MTGLKCVRGWRGGGVEVLGIDLGFEEGTFYFSRADLYRKISYYKCTT